MPKTAPNLADPVGAFAEMTRWSLFAWQAGWVFTLRSASLWAEPATAAPALTEMALEKQRAFTQGWMDAGRKALQGADARQIANAAMALARRRVAANAKTLGRS